MSYLWTLLCDIASRYLASKLIPVQLLGLSLGRILAALGREAELESPRRAGQERKRALEEELGKAAREQVKRQRLEEDSRVSGSLRSSHTLLPSLTGVTQFL